MNTPTHSLQGSGARLVSTEGRVLPLKAAAVRADAKGGVARVVLTQTFENPYDVPLTVTYTFALPADAAVSGYAFELGSRRIVGEVDRRGAARARFEQAVSEGRAAAILDQERSSLFTQELGNIPPGAKITAEITLDQRLVWNDEGSWEWRFPLSAAPRYLSTAGRVADASKVTLDVLDVKAQPIAVRAAVTLVVRDAMNPSRLPECPSHPVHAMCTESAATFEVDAALDRDVVIRWPVSEAKVGLSLDVGRPEAGDASQSAYGVLTIVPPLEGPGRKSVPRDLVVLLDTSGSMGGAPLDQARRVASALVATLGEVDSLELLEFSNEPRRWKKGAVRVTPNAKKEALAWIASLRASGGTEMRDGIYAALASLRSEAQRQVVLVTDGLIGFEHEIVATIADKLPAGSRVHTVGIGSSVNRSLTGPAARAGRGVEVVIGLDEDPERAAKRIVSRTSAPLVVDVTVEGSAVIERAPDRVPDLFAGAPLLVSLALRPEGGDVVVRGRSATGVWEARTHVSPCAKGEGTRVASKLFARERVEDLETRIASARGEAGMHDSAIESLGLRHQIATRKTSWVATGDMVVDPMEPTRREAMPQTIPYGMAPSMVTGAPPPPPSGMPILAMPCAPPCPKPLASGPTQGESLASRVFSRVAGVFDSRGRAPEVAKASRAKAGEVKANFLEIAEDCKPREESQASERTLQGRVTTRKQTEIVLEASVDSDLTWTLAAGDAVIVLFRDGSSRIASVKQCTRKGALRAGVTLRIVLTLALPDAQRVVAAVTFANVRIELEDTAGTQ